MEENKIFVNNMSFDTKEEQIRELFGEFGEITDLKMITDRDTGRFRGFCFITFADADSAGNAKNELNGKEFNGREIFVDIAKPQRDRNNNRSFGKRY